MTWFPASIPDHPDPNLGGWHKPVVPDRYGDLGLDPHVSREHRRGQRVVRHEVPVSGAGVHEDGRLAGSCGAPLTASRVLAMPPSGDQVQICNARSMFLMHYTVWA